MTKLITGATILALLIGVYLTYPRYMEMIEQEPLEGWEEMMK